MSLGLMLTQSDTVLNTRVQTVSDSLIIEGWRRMAVTVRDVAREAGVATATAARALSGYGVVKPATLEKVLLAASRLGYRTNSVAQALRSGSLKSIGFIAGDIENPFFATVARYLADALDVAGYTLLVASSDERIEREKRIIESFRSQLIAGLVVAPSAYNDGAHLKELADSGLPLVLVDRSIPGLAVDEVQVDNEAAADSAVDHLLGLGHRRIGILTDSLNIDSSRARLAGFEKAHKRWGVPVDPGLIVIGTSSRTGAYEAARRLLERANRPTAVFSADLFMTEGVLGSIRRLGLNVPEDLSLVGFDDADLMTFVSPPVTVVAQPVAEVGVRAAELILQRVSGGHASPNSVRLHAELIVRKSTSALQTPAPLGSTSSDAAGH